MRRSVLAGVLVCSLGCVLGCATTPRHLTVADRHLSRGDLERAALAYELEQSSARTEQQAVRARLLRVLVNLKLQKSERALEALRSIEYQTPRSTWGLIAGLLADEVVRGRVLRETLIHADAELHDKRGLILKLEQTLDSIRQACAEQDLELAELKEERAKLQAQAREANERSAQHAKRVRELEQELDALKHIDMERQP